MVSGHPQTEALALQALSPEEGHSFLDIGSGTGFVTLLAAHLVGSTGTSIGVEVQQSGGPLESPLEGHSFCDLAWLSLESLIVHCCLVIWREGILDHACPGCFACCHVHPIDAGRDPRDQMC